MAVVAPALWAIAPAAANPEVTVEVPAAVPVSAAQAATFGTGVMPALGVYQRLTPHLALGLRARVGALGDGGAPMAGRADAGWGGLATLAVAVRAGGAGAWLELAGGGGVTGVDPVPALEAGAGWATRVGPLEAGPALRVEGAVGDPVDAEPESAGVLEPGRGHHQVAVELVGQGVAAPAHPHGHRRFEKSGVAGRQWTA